MQLFQSIIFLFLALSCLVTVASGARRDDEDTSERALKDLQTGMAGLKEATQNPALLAQLMRDLQVRVFILSMKLVHAVKLNIF